MPFKFSELTFNLSYCILCRVRDRVYIKESKREYLSGAKKIKLKIQREESKNKLSKFDQCFLKLSNCEVEQPKPGPSTSN